MKKIYNISLFFFISIFLNIILNAQSYKDIGILPCEGIRGTEFTGLVEVSDGFVAMGYVDTFYNGQYGTGRVWVVKLNPSGAVKWSHFYSDTNKFNSWWGRKIAKADNNGVYVLGDNQAKNGFLLKIDKDGKVIWNKTCIVHPDNSWDNDMISTSDEGCLIVGTKSDSGAYVKYYKDGSIAFKGLVKGANDYKLLFTGVDLASDGGYYLVGTQREWVPIPRDRFLMVKISASGQLLWRKTYHGGNYNIEDKKQSNGFAVCALPGGGFIAGGGIYKESIWNYQSFLMKGSDNGDTLWTKYLFEELYPANGSDNVIRKLILDSDKIYTEFVEAEGSSISKNFLVSLNVSDGKVNWRQTGYKLSDQHTRNLQRILKTGQVCFTGGEFYLDYPKHGLILWTTPDGLWLPPRIIKFENGVYKPQLITKMDPHIEAVRIVQIATDINFSSVVYEKNNISSDTILMDLSSIKEAKYFLRVGIIGGKGNTIWSDILEFILFSVPKLRYTDQVPVFSSEYGGGWSASQIIGLPNVYPDYGDHIGAWSSSTADQQREYIECKFKNPTPITGIVVFETYNPGAIDTIYVRNPGTNKWEVVYAGTATPALQFARAWGIPLPLTTFPVSEVRLAINSPAVPGYNEIDAVGLIDATSIGTSEPPKSLQELKVYPNPAGNLAKISWINPLEIAAECIVTDVSGHEYIYKRIPAGNTECIIQVSNLNTGIYWININYAGNMHSTQFIKK